MNKLLEIKPDALGGLPANATPKEAEEFRARFNNWYQRFRRRRQFSIRRRISVGQKLHRTRGYGVGDADEASEGSRGARW